MNLALGRILPIVAVLFVASARAAVAQMPSDSNEPDVPERAGKELRALKISELPPRIDGVLDDDIWRAADVIEDFVQLDPDNMAPGKERTTVRVAYDDEAIYIAVYNYMANPAEVAAGLGRRENFPPSDRIEIGFDPRHDHLTGYAFATNPSGVKGDYSTTDDSDTTADYDAVWDVRTQRTLDGWTAEFRIPFSQMRFTAGAGRTVWGFQVRREVSRSGENRLWVGTPRGARGNISRFGHLVFEEGIPPSRRLEFSPFVLGRSSSTPAADPTQQVDAGIDMRYGITSNSTLSMAINPDFGQVEQDPAVLNLTVFETQFEEKRQFFLEDSRIFVLPYGQFPDFYSPRIGRRPGRISLPSGDRLVNQPDRTTILGAGKLTGKSQAWTYGALSALTDQEFATVEPIGWSPGDPLVSRMIEPRTSYNVLRLQRDVLGTSSNVGWIGTAVVRDGDLDAFTTGGDANVRWRQNRYQVTTHWVGSRAPLGGQMRNGYAGSANFSYANRSITFGTHFDTFSKYFRNSDIGFLTSRVNKWNIAGELTLARPDPGRFTRTATTLLGIAQTTNGDGLTVGRLAFANGSIKLLNYWTVSANANHFFRGFSDLDTRGGPPIVTPASQYVDLSVSSDSRRSWNLLAAAAVSSDQEGGGTRALFASLQLQPSPRLQGSVSVRNSSSRYLQWITNSDVNGDMVVDYVFGQLTVNAIDVTARGTFAFSRDLTVEGYLQPFISVGDYTEIKRFTRPKSYDFEPATINFDPDFSTKSLRSNVVLRWEYTRGSTLYLVWQMSGTDESNPGDFVAGRDFRNAFSGEHTNIFTLKTTYWLGL